ncbi:MAG: GNAT family N-acetyltransferase [bacterium]
MSSLADYARIPIAFEVRSVLDVASHSGGRGGFTLSERALDAPYTKDYDAVDDDAPARWSRRFDLTTWGLLIARLDGRRVGGAAISIDALGSLTEGRDRVATLRDIRVSVAARKSGVGSALFGATEGWAIAKGCRTLEIETQNINVPACRFYAKHGCALASIDRCAYPTLPREIQLIWRKDLCEFHN